MNWVLKWASILFLCWMSGFGSAQTLPPVDMLSFEKVARIGRGKFSERLPKEITDRDIFSPKSVRFSASGKKIYINSLEGGKTVVYEWPGLRKLKTISHRFGAKQAFLFKGETTVFDYPYFTQSQSGNANEFTGKPVESELSADGRYLWVPYYRRSYDHSGQSPGAVAIIDTVTDAIVRVMPTGPIPKYVVASPDGKSVAVIHWGDNTIGLIDVSSGKPESFRYVAHLVVEKKLSQEGLAGEDRDQICGFCLRGSVFTPDSQHLLVARLGKGGIAAFHIPSRTYLGTVINVPSTPRHLVIGPDLETLYASSNFSGYVSKISISALLESLKTARGQRIQGPVWQKEFVGKGARTLDINPAGDTLFVAVNSSSELVAVDSRSLKIRGRIAVDSFAVGLAVSPDGDFVIVTSQGHSGQGGNSVNLIRLVDPQ